jgi:hypothetical protein
MRTFLLAVPALLLLAPQASALPILSAAPSSIPLSTQTVLTLSINTNDGSGDVPLTALDLDLLALTSGLQILAAVSLVPSIVASGPGASGSDTLVSFVGTFGPPPLSGFIDVGTLTVQGVVAGTPIRALGNFTDAFFTDIPIDDPNLATAVPEPASAALIGLGIALLAAWRRTAH